uniref:SEA domain-containing protein n=1 Tax=Syphacia muris TaxID=451379 RepID=A0A0N5B1H3_9BILA
MYDEYPRREHHSHHRSRSYRKGSNIWRDAIRSRRKIFGVIGTLAILVVLLIIALIVMIIIYVKKGSDNSTTTVSTSISSPTQTKKVRSIVFAYENPRYVSNNTTRRKRDTTTHEPSPAQTIRQFIEKQKEKEKDVETTYHIITFYEETKNFTGLFTEQALKILAENDNTTRKRTNPVQKKALQTLKQLGLDIKFTSSLVFPAKPEDYENETYYDTEMSQSVEVLKEMQVQPTGAEPTETVKLILVVANKSSSYFEGFTAVDTNNAKLDDVVTQIENELPPPVIIPVPPTTPTTTTPKKTPEIPTTTSKFALHP